MGKKGWLSPGYQMGWRQRDLTMSGQRAQWQSQGLLVSQSFDEKTLPLLCPLLPAEETKILLTPAKLK